MKIWVDADACPAAIKEIIIKAAIKRQVQTIFVANKPIYLQASNYLSFIQVSAGADIADLHIIEHTALGDIIITQDVILAAKLIAKKAVVISVHGTIFTGNNIGERLAIRNLLQDIRDTGGQTKGPKPYSQKDKKRFAQIFDQQLTKALNLRE